MCEHVDCDPKQYPSVDLSRYRLGYPRLKAIAARVQESLFAVYDVRVGGQPWPSFLDVDALIYKHRWWDWGEAAVLLAAARGAPYGLYPPEGYAISEILAKECDPISGGRYVVWYRHPDDGEELIAIMRKTIDGCVQMLCERSTEGLLLKHKTNPRYSHLFEFESNLPPEAYSLTEIRELLGKSRVADLAQRLVFQNTFPPSNSQNLSCPRCSRA